MGRCDSIAASRGLSELTQNVIMSSHGHSTPSLKIACKSVQPFSRNLANKETKKQKSLDYNTPSPYRGQGNNKICTQCVPNRTIRLKYVTKILSTITANLKKIVPSITEQSYNLFHLFGCSSITVCVILSRKYPNYIAGRLKHYKIICF